MRTLIIFVAILAVSCNSKSGHMTASVPIEQPKPAIRTIQVVHPSGMIENIEDKLFIHPTLGDTVIIHDIYIMHSDSTFYSDRFLWGRYTRNTPQAYYCDSVVSEYLPVRVVRYVN